MSNEDLDKFLAEKVMGWEYLDNLNIWSPGLEDEVFSKGTWHPTKDWNQAITCLKKSGVAATIEIESFSFSIKTSSILIGIQSRDMDRWALAICRAIFAATKDE